jgi:hypothetical protein
MSYTYFKSGSTLTFRSSSTIMIDDFNDFLNNQFYNASNVWTVQEETPFASGSFSNVDARIDSAIDNLTGAKLGDDFRILKFNVGHVASKIGDKFYFDDNYWLVDSSESIKSLVNNSVVRRCNNVLRWMNSGSALSEHCIIDYTLRSSGNTGNNPIIPNGIIRIYCQQNARTNTIHENQRFLLGNTSFWQCYRILGGGISSFVNSKTEDNTSSRLMEIVLDKNFVNNDTDDTVNGIADYYKEISGSATLNSIKILPVSGSIVEGQTVSFDVRLYSGSTVLSDGFTFSISASSTVPTDHYTFTSTGSNTFSVANIEKYLDSSLLIDCTSGSNLRTKSIELRGAF